MNKATNEPRSGAIEPRMGTDGAVNSTARYFQQCRKIRNLSTYSRSGIVSSGEVKELIEEAARFGQVVRRWVEEKYPGYC